jgi:hypothetical protein
VLRWITVMLVGLALVSSVEAETVSFDFSGDPGQPAGWTNSNSGGANVTAFSLNGAGRYANALSATAGATATTATQALDNSTFAITDRQAGTAFALTSTFTNPTLTASSSWNFQIGVKFLATGVGENSGHTNSFYSLHLYRDNSRSGVDLTKAVNGVGSTVGQLQLTNGNNFDYLSPAAGAYTLSINATYNLAGDLQIAWEILNVAEGNLSGTFTDAIGGTDGAPLTGNLFGIRTRGRNFSGGTLAFSSSFDDYTVTYTPIPEPASLGLLALGLLLVRRRVRT